MKLSLKKGLGTTHAILKARRHSSVKLVQEEFGWTTKTATTIYILTTAVIQWHVLFPGPLAEVQQLLMLECSNWKVKYHHSRVELLRSFLVVNYQLSTVNF